MSSWAFQPLLPAAQQLSGGGGVNGVGESSQAQTTSAIGSAAPAAVTGTVSTSQAQTVALAGNSAIPAAVTGTISTSQAQTVALAGNSSIPAAVSGTASTSQAQSVEGTASGGITPVDEGIQPIHGYNFDNDRRLLKARREKSLGGHYWKPEELASVEPLVTRLPMPSELEELPPIAPKPRINRLDTFASAHSALAEIGIHYKQSPIDYSSVINALQAEIQQQQDDDMAIATLVAMLI